MPEFKVVVLTLFPEMFPGPLQYSLAGRALEKNIWSLEIVNIRDFGIGKHKNVDAPAIGGGNGLIMRSDVLAGAIDAAKNMLPNAPIYYPSPRGERVSQPFLKEVQIQKNIIILCGRYEGIDERVIDEYNLQQISLGDFILSGGEVAALSILDGVVRLIPGVLENQDTLKDESFEPSLEIEEKHFKAVLGEEKEFFIKDKVCLLEHPLYTKPTIWRGKKVPDILLSGNHQQIAEWKKMQKIKITAKYRPDLIENIKD